MLINESAGSWFFLGEIYTDIALAHSEPKREKHCGTCSACLDTCPTGAFVAPFVLDARRCISYLTIEHKGPIDIELREQMGNHIYGCDDCLAACPWNKFAAQASDIRYHARDDLAAPDLASLVTLDDTAFRAKFSGSPIKRIGRNRFVRNVLYAIGNSGNRDLANHAKPLVLDTGDTVAEAAKWALERLENNPKK